MDYTQEMNLVSTSGYCMPFEERDGEVKMLLGYGEQAHPKSGETFSTTAWISARIGTYWPQWPTAW